MKVIQRKNCEVCGSDSLHRWKKLVILVGLNVKCKVCKTTYRNRGLSSLLGWPMEKIVGWVKHLIPVLGLFLLLIFLIALKDYGSSMMALLVFLILIYLFFTPLEIDFEDRKNQLIKRIWDKKGGL